VSDVVRSQARIRKLRGEPKAQLLLSQGHSLKEVSEEAGVSERTLRRRLRDPEYEAEVGRLRADYLSEAVSKLARSSTIAVETLVELAVHAESENVRLGASKAILEFGVSLSENLEVRQRISALEEVLYTQAGDLRIRREVSVDG
jgi:transposase